MKIMVSACLLGQNCKYNGGNNYSEKVAEYIKGHEVIPVCPEVEGGLPVPRIPCEIVNGIVTNKQVYDGSFSGKLIEGKGIFAELLAENGIKTIDLSELLEG